VADPMRADSFHSTCCVVGGGPAGIMLGYLLARAGVDVTVLEKHKDFIRDFRGDTIHPSTLELLHELGLLQDFLQLPHQKVTSVRAQFAESSLELANLRGLKTRCPYIALMPQWDFLNFLAERGGRYPGFDLRMEHEAVDLIHEGNRVRGVTVRTPGGIQYLWANLVIACDGRHSAMRAAAGFPVHEIGVPIDVLWFRISRNPDDPAEQVLGNINYGKVLILIDRGDYFQAGLIIRKGSFAGIKQDGLAAFRETIARIAPRLAGRVEEITDWDQVKLLTVQINRLRRWHRPGLLCIGDAAHAMSPAFGVGINLAIQDAVAAANLLADALRQERSTDALLADVQRRREFPARVTQLLQVLAHKGLAYIFRQQGPMRPPMPLRVAVRIPGIQHTLGRVVAIGVRPEKIKGQAATRTAAAGRVRQIAAICAGVAAAVTVARGGGSGRSRREHTRESSGLETGAKTLLAADERG
jgi:2-polyprenyl-6-methoxyphenol hydroxylase-like FAD-dependent oxidoreductase